MGLRKILAIVFLLFASTPIFPVCAANTNIAVTKPIKILLVPGHDNQVWGAQYGTMKEATMTLALATQIYNILKKDKRFEVHVTRDGTPPLSYTKEFADYFTNHWSDIIAFEQNAKKLMQNNITNGSFVVEPNAPHHKVNSDVALRLYGLNKWADDNNMDAMIHIHFNDYPRANKWTIGQYKGFAIYLPNGQFANGKESGQLAADIWTQLRKKYITSTYPPEAGGMVPDQQLIAIGANGTLNASVRSVLVEYSYIYEKKFRNKSTRLQAYKTMAQLTAKGIQNYFFPTSPYPSPERRGEINLTPSLFQEKG
jgi:N-acetylmuramoyl-L-alanine amidase